MVSADGPATPVGPAPTCPDCQAALQAAGRDAVSFLLVDSLTIPVVGCEEHLEQFREICGLTTEDAARLLSHVPAGGIVCPGCRQARHKVEHPIVQIQDGAAGVFGCTAHTDELIDRFQTGLHTRRQLRDDGPL